MLELVVQGANQYNFPEMFNCVLSLAVTPEPLQKVLVTIVRQFSCNYQHRPGDSDLVTESEGRRAQKGRRVMEWRR